MQKSPQSLSSTATDSQFGSLACFAVSVCVLVLGFWKLFSLELSEGQLFLGSLLVLNLAIMGVVAGLLVPITLRAQELAFVRERQQS